MRWGRKAAELLTELAGLPNECISTENTDGTLYQESSRAFRKDRFLSEAEQFGRARSREGQIRLGELPRGVRMLTLLGYASVVLLLMATLFFELWGYQKDKGEGRRCRT